MSDRNFDAFLKLDKSGLRGKYVILVDGKVVKKGINIEKMLEEALKKYPRAIPLVAKIPEKEMLVL